MGEESSRSSCSSRQVQQNPSPVITQASTVHLPSPVTPVLTTPVSSPRVTPQVTPESIPHAAGVFGLPASPYDTRHSARCGQHSRRAASPASTIDSLERHGTPELDGTPLIHKRGRGRPCKTPQPPSYEDYPVNASTEDIKKWKRRKNTEKWRYDKLMSNEAEDFREKEKEQVTKYVSEK